ncbi:putative lipid kinase YegS [Shimia sp. SK013]|uniref:YegS/Rv2252/BmrU family lipid kinase n=1 Tax=Shimia sp. SK013 TaxID=1389006 RepID=UPI0006B5ECF9|nr:YegS/Rv2252/BmrU family lipid kinase [Shimia sp. SK013]KPA20383.1 putative lipid kinase YegS [Shimia sp. SK013]
MCAKPLLLLNRKSAVRSDIRTIVKKLQLELELDVWVPWSGKQTRKLIKQAIKRGTTRVIGAGGDGTVNAVANAILRMDLGDTVDMGLVPLGTANDFARAFGDDGSDPEAALRRAVTGESKSIDLGRINGDVFVNVASGGYGAMITATTDVEIKRRLGGIAYTLAGVARLGELAPTKARVTLDGGETREVDLTIMAIGNSRFAGGGFDVTPLADVSDGKLDFAMLAAPGAVERRPDLRSLFEQDDLTEAFMYRAQFEKAVIETEAPYHINLDGEPMVNTRFEVDVLPGALRLVPPGKG